MTSLLFHAKVKLRTLLLTLSWLALLGIGTASSAQNLLAQNTVRTGQVTAELLAHAPDGIASGHTVWLGLKLSHAPEWHTYWKNSGDSGLPTQLEWQLPPGVQAGAIHWPTPKKFPIGSLANYGYDGTAMLLVPLHIDAAFSGQKLVVGLDASWLACRKECIPEEGHFQLQLPTDQPTTVDGVAFETARAYLPSTIDKDSLTVHVVGPFIDLAWRKAPADWKGLRLEVFPETPGLIEPGAPWEQHWRDGVWTARLPLSPLRAESPTTFPLVLARTDQPAGQPVPAGLTSEPPVSGEWPPVQAMGAGVSDALQAALKDNAARSSNTPTAAVAPQPLPWGWVSIWVGALLGGMILNLMPCVFPVLAIKVLAFAQHAEDRRSHRLSGLAYTAGVVMSFTALGALLLALRAGGEQLGWGFQLQNPAVVAALATLFTVIGLNLSGMFEFGNVLPSSLATLQVKNPLADAFLTGVLATAIASPCTAPFMGASLGLAIALPAAQALTVFALLGLGMALPYLAASWMPALARALPRPGAWMNTLRQFMAFPMWATVVWLLWVLGQQSGIDGAAALLMLLVALSWLIWALGLRGRGRRALIGLSLVSMVWLSWAIGPYVTQPSESAEPVHPRSGVQNLGWEAWSPERQSELLAQGRPVFVDFTAAWCVTCQYNKRTTLAHPDVLAEAASRHVALLRADWTRRDPAVTRALAQLGRNGVPVYVLHAPGAAVPVVLSELLTVSEVRQALAGL